MFIKLIQKAIELLKEYLPSFRKTAQGTDAIAALAQCLFTFIARTACAKSIPIALQNAQLSIA